MKKRIIASVVVLVLIIGYLPIYSQATDELKIRGYLTIMGMKFVYILDVLHGTVFILEATGKKIQMAM